MPRYDDPVPADARAGGMLALVQIAPLVRVLATSTDRAKLLREMGIRLGEVRETRGAPLHKLAIQEVMHLG